ncbi:Major facilitator superfamily domain, general substrate transporter [Purpureocillium lavendulum]|uniref:Major facilitator superfamily domain, general substrate transporter n=1 Tax=Purpureocillium lavendulum TaxID=1247861 RepID=A0AB34FQ37_9HYPO|nr:Major facilitator superfamily domain, general substrate transporter [Purpureocillium lavendulum]
MHTNRVLTSPPPWAAVYMMAINDSDIKMAVDDTDGTRYDGAVKDSSDVVVEAAPSRVSWASSVTMVMVGGMALFSDGYNASIVGFMNPVLSRLYPDDYTSSIKTSVSNAFLIGEVFGMLFFGWGIDKLGRRSGIVWATIFLVLGIIIATAAHGTTNNGMFWMLIIGRGVAGFGAGGEYPTCATSTTEASDENAPIRQRRGILTAVATDFAIDLGFVVGGIVAIIVLVAYHNRVSDGLWRVNFGIGIILPVILLFFRLRLVNSTQYHKHAMKKEIPYMLVLKRYWKPMLGTSLAWFMYDFVTYPFGIFGSTILDTLNPDGTLLQTIGYGTVLNTFLLPGTIIGGLLMDRIGRKQTMTLGFVLWSVLAFIIGGALKPILTVFPLFVVLYGIFNTLGEMGPGVATFLCAAESFPTPVRGHFLGFAAAVGKAGAAIGTQVFNPIQNSFHDDEKGVQGVFLIGAAFALTGAVISWFLIPDREKDLESEDVRFRHYLEENGYHGTFGEDVKATISVSTA